MPDCLCQDHADGFCRRQTKAHGAWPHRCCQCSINSYLNSRPIPLFDQFDCHAHMQEAFPNCLPCRRRKKWNQRPATKSQTPMVMMTPVPPKICKCTLCAPKCTLCTPKCTLCAPKSLLSDTNPFSHF